MKKICARCFREFNEGDDGPSPVEALGQIFVDVADDQDAGDICPACREDLGILNILGFSGDEPKYRF